MSTFPKAALLHLFKDLGIDESPEFWEHYADCITCSIDTDYGMGISVYKCKIIDPPPEPTFKVTYEEGVVMRPGSVMIKVYDDILRQQLAVGSIFRKFT